MKRVIRWASLGLALACVTSGGAPPGGRDSEETIQLELGQSALIDLPAEVVRISVGNPELVDAVAVSEREIMINSKSRAGTGTIAVWDRSGRRKVYQVEVRPSTSDKLDHDVAKIQELFQDTFPQEQIRVHAAQGVVSVTGRVSSQQVAEAALELAKPLGGVVSNFQVGAAAGPEGSRFLSWKGKPASKRDNEIQTDLVQGLIDSTFPNEHIRVGATQGLVTLSGSVSSPEVAESVLSLLRPLSKSIISNLDVPAEALREKQILLRVRFAELNRSAASSLGFNLISTGAFNTPMRTTTGQFPAPFPTQMSTPGDDKKGVSGIIPGGNSGFFSNFSISDALNVFAFRPDLNVGAFIQALQSQGLLQILAEPNLVATNGKEASFLAGGEFPVPVVQGGAGVGAVTIMFREFGIRLSFTPQITGHKTIKMHVKPEVSTLDPSAGVQLSGFNIPGLATRRMETDVELSEGQSFVIAGLIDDRATENLARVPGLANIPILGTLFRSRQENKTRTELVVMVTPEITRPVAAGEVKAGPVMPNAFLPPLPAPREKPAGKRDQPSGKKP